MSGRTSAEVLSGPGWDLKRQQVAQTATWPRRPVVDLSPEQMWDQLSGAEWHAIGDGGSIIVLHPERGWVELVKTDLVDNVAKGIGWALSGSGGKWRGVERLGPDPVAAYLEQPNYGGRWLDDATLAVIVEFSDH